MTSTVIISLVAALVCTAVLRFVSTIIRITTPTNRQLRFGKLVLFFAWLNLVASIGMLILLLADKSLDAGDAGDAGILISGVFMVMGFFGGAIYLFGEYYKVGGSYDENGIIFSTPWTGRKEELWDDLSNATFNGGYYILTFKSDKKICISQFLLGYGGILKILKSKGYNF